ncbi:monoglyceride lipase-like isoform X2 [Tachypleus tridentatus]|uniref:monoglyceride lipase-like isoform X2 n=1 Tax=Tachypleus tridentatus TaxID=6853 RepID=UPI003FD2C4E1
MVFFIPLSLVMLAENAPYSCKDYYLKSCTGHRLFCKCWATPGTPRALAFFAHGFGEHCALYKDLIHALVKTEILTFGHDHVGHGRSGGPRTLVGSLDNCVNDIFKHIDMMKGKYPGLPVFLIGHSMHFVAKWFGWLVPNFPVSTIIDLDLAVRTSESKELLLKDPHTFKGTRIKAGWARTVMNTIPNLNDQLQFVGIPLLILHGGQDKICDVQCARQLYRTSKSQDKRLKVYPDSYHCLFLEPEDIADEVLEEIRNWIKNRI